jgi:CubicO group peptidase (beta-lactamase class C family)
MTIDRTDHARRGHQSRSPADIRCGYAPPMTDLDEALAAIDTWGAEHAAAAVLGPSGILAIRGDRRQVFRWASVTKIATALAVLDQVDRGVIGLDEPAGPPGATVRHLLAHASGLPFEGMTPIAAPGTRRIYSNGGFDTLGTLVADRAGQPFEAVLGHLFLEPLGMRSTTLRERPSQGLHGPLDDLVALARQLLTPTLLRPATFRLATSVAFPGLIGQLPGVGRFDPLDWGLGFELRNGKVPHWTGSRNSPATFGHFGGAGTFVWVDPVARLATVLLTDREYDAWALEAWPPFSDSVLASVGQPGA